ncbi:hypothetical protein AAFC00_001821 [Neodothiora populina]|uniref:Uncharacterized protein n=1 Tax=Neodothiora populina TaxID=2781224 RepID=A0ABR3PRC0_9PEZI
MATKTANAQLDSVRLSTYSGAPSIQPSLAPSSSTTASQRPVSSISSDMNASHHAAGASNGGHDEQSSNSRHHRQSSSTAVASDGPNYDSEKIACMDPVASTTTLGSTDPRTQDLKTWSAGFERMQDERLEKQRYVMSGKKGDEVSLTALGAKVERALGRRMTGQDAVFTPRRQTHLAAELPAELPEKRSMEVGATS